MNGNNINAQNRNHHPLMGANARPVAQVGLQEAGYSSSSVSDAAMRARGRAWDIEMRLKSVIDGIRSPPPQPVAGSSNADDPSRTPLLDVVCDTCDILDRLQSMMGELESLICPA